MMLEHHGLLNMINDVCRMKVSTRIALQIDSTLPQHVRNFMPINNSLESESQNRIISLHLL